MIKMKTYIDTPGSTVLLPGFKVHPLHRSSRREAPSLMGGGETPQRSVKGKSSPGNTSGTWREREVELAVSVSNSKHSDSTFFKLDYYRLERLT